MVTTAYNFKQWFKRHYPDIMINPVYGLEAYTFDKPLNPEHMFEYNVQQLANGQYIVFVGRNPEQVIELMRDISKNGLQYKKPERGIPTTFSSFENWYRSKQLKPLHRTHITKTTAADALHDETLEHVKRDWYMYEFSMDPARCDNADQLFAEDKMKFGGPYVYTESGTIVLLIKSPVSSYVSKRQLFLQKFTLMQPLFEQLVTACAKDEWDKATGLAEQYMGIQFDTEGTVDTEALKAAYTNSELSLFVRCRGNLKDEPVAEM